MREASYTLSIALSGILVIPSALEFVKPLHIFGSVLIYNLTILLSPIQVYAVVIHFCTCWSVDYCFALFCFVPIVLVPIVLALIVLALIVLALIVLFLGFFLIGFY